MNMKKSHFLQKMLVLVVAFLMVAIPITSVYAIDESTLDRYAQSNILFYDPAGGACAGGSYLDGPIVLSGDTPEEKIWTGLTSFMTPEQAAGVMGNMKSESGFNPAQHEISMMRDNPGFALDQNEGVSYGLGLIQWSFGRRIGMYTYVKESNESLVVYFNNPKQYSPDYWSGSQFIAAAGVDAFDALVSLELQYLKDELQNISEYSGIFNTTTVEEATEYFLAKVERPKNPDLEHHPERLTQAKAFYEQFDGTGGGGGGCTTNLGSLADFIKAYAWPSYRGPGFLQRMPEYENAVSRRISAHKYVGGTVAGVPGIDCGGFITTLMQESGFDPDYNGCASNTGPQEYWLREGGGSDKWVWLNPGGSPMNAADLQLGDVAFTGGYTGSCSPGGDHTYIFIGDGFGFETNVASASYSSGNNGRAPMSGHEGIAGARWYRKVK